MGRMRYGVHRALEAEADEIIGRSLAGVTSQSEKADILTPWKENQRRRREVYTSTGTPDPAVRKGMYHRRANPTRPELNSRDGIARAQQDPSHRRPSSSLADFVANMMEQP